MEERPRDISSWILIAVLIYTAAAMWRSLGEWPARDPAGDLRWRHQQRWGDDPISNQDLEQLPLAGTIRQRGSPFCGPTTAAAQSFWTNIFQRDPQVVTHFMILRGSHHSLDSTSQARRNAKDEWVIKGLVINLAQEYTTGVVVVLMMLEMMVTLFFQHWPFFFVSFGHSVIHFDDFISLSSPIPNR